MIEIEELKNFLNEANKSTYANKLADKAASTRLASEDYHFEKDGLIYHDTYFGSRDFIGEEIIYKEQIPIWGANYYGFIKKPEISEKDLYSFLREALMQEYSDIIPVRGPARFTNGEWFYSNGVDGSLDNFGGTETICFKGEEVYRCWYHGGFIK